MGFAIITVIFLIAVGFLVIVGIEMWNYTYQYPKALDRMEQNKHNAHHHHHKKRKAS